MDNKNQVDILMTKDSKGAMAGGIYSMDFKQGNTYRVPAELAETFFKMGVAAVNAKSAEIPGGPFVLHVKNCVPSWGQETKTDE